jgi:hypothetical protein
MDRQKPIEHSGGRVAGAQPLGDVWPERRGQERERNEGEEIGHGRTLNRRGAPSNESRPMPPRQRRAGPDLSFYYKGRSRTSATTFRKLPAADRSKNAGFSGSAVAYGLLVARREYGIVSDIQL